MRRTHAVAALPVAALLLLLASFASLYTALHIDRPLNLADLDATNAAAERLRIIWGAAAFSVTAALVWNAVVSCYVLGVVLAKEDRTTRFAFVTGAAVAALVGVLMVTFLEAGGTVANELLKRIELCANVKIGFLTRIGNIAAAVTVSIMLASLSSLAIPRRSQQIHYLAGMIRLWLLSLYGAAMLLAVAVVEVWALYHWGAAVSSAEAAEALAPVADGAALAAALIFSTLLAAMYLPVGLLHTKWLNAVVELESRHTQQLDVEKWLARWGIKSSAVSIGTAVVLPAIAFILTTLLKRAIGATQSG